MAMSNAEKCKNKREKQTRSGLKTWHIIAPNTAEAKAALNALAKELLTSSPRLKPGDSSCETAMPCRENVPCCIDISIMQRPTVGASPFSDSKSCSTFLTVDGNASTTRTRLGT